MTQTSPPQEPDQDSGSTDAKINSPVLAASNDSAPENTSDNETSERPVREKLKKTSIASIYYNTKNQDSPLVAPNENGGINVVSKQKEPFLGETLEDLEYDTIRGRPVKKRSFDDIEAAEMDTDIAAKNSVGKIESTNGHARKRSKDVRTSETMKGDKQLRAVDATVEEEGEDPIIHGNVPGSLIHDDLEASTSPTAPLEKTHGMDIERRADDKRQGANTKDNLPATGPERTDLEMRDPTASPRKKRSRDQLDTDLDRDQKIPATEGARAQRRSDELERTGTMKGVVENVAAQKISMPRKPIPSPSPDVAADAGSGSEDFKVNALQISWYLDVSKLTSLGTYAKFLRKSVEIDS